MDEDITIILQKQADALPSEIRKYIISGEWEKTLENIIQHYKLSEETSGVLSREVMLVLAGLVHPGVFRGEFASDINDIDDPTIDAIVKEVTDSIFQPILPILKIFLKEQDAAPDPTLIPVPSTPSAPVVPETPKEKEKITIPAPPSLGTPQSSVWGKISEVLPENLPTGEIAVSPPVPEVIQNIPSPASVPPLNNQTQGGIEGGNEQSHPFEEKMKKVFTGGMVDRGGLVLDTKSTNEPIAVGGVPARPTHDPYREPIE